MPGKLKSGLTNLKGHQIGSLMVLYRIQGKRRWKCKCVAEGCGKEIIVEHNRLIHKVAPKTHCGCQNRGIQSKYKREYHAWWDAKSRCHNPDHPSFSRYGAKGIEMSPEWRESFEKFLADVGPRPKGTSLDRIDPFGPYAKHNVRWATDIVQARNKKGTKFVTHPITGEQVTIGELAEYTGCTYQQMYSRLKEEGKI